MLAMPVKKRFMEGADMIDFTRILVENGIRKQNPGISDLDMKMAVFKKYYKNDFTEEQLNDIFLFFKANNPDC